MYTKSNEFRKKNIVTNNKNIFMNRYHEEREEFMYDAEEREIFRFAYDRIEFGFDTYSFPVMIFKISKKIRRNCRF